MDEKELERVRRSLARGEKAGRTVRAVVNVVGRALGLVNKAHVNNEPQPPQLLVHNIDEVFEYQPEGVRCLARHFYNHGPLADDVWEFADVCEHVLDHRRGADVLRLRAWVFPSAQACESENSNGNQCQRVRCDGVHAWWGEELRIWMEGEYPHRSWLIDASLWELSQKALLAYGESRGNLPDELIDGLPFGNPCLMRSVMGFPCEMHKDHGPLHLNFSAGVRGRNFLYWREDGIARFATRRGR